MSLEPREYSKRLGVLTPEQFQAALDRFDLGALVDAQPVSGGLFGQNVFLTSTSGEWVLRGAPHYDGQLQKERFFSRLIHEETKAEAPWPFFIERSDEIFGWHYALMPRLPGENPGDGDVQAALTKDGRIELAHALGGYLARIESKTWDHCATYDHATEQLAPLAMPYAVWITQQVRDWLHRCRSRSWFLDAPVDPATSKATTDADIAWIEEIIRQAQHALAVPFAPVIVHTDYKENNTAAERTDDGWRFTGVFDLGECYIGDGEYDLARSACSYHAFGSPVLRAFVDAYHEGRPPRDGFTERMRLYILLDRLIIWEYGQRNHIWFPEGLTLRRWAEPFVDMKIAP
jgi:aminoglycoside phosphotransferase (APT) family kinase protein